MTLLTRAQQGFTLIELIFFIAIIGVLAAGLTLPFSTLFGNMHYANDQTRAVELAEGAMDFAIGQKRLQGFAALSTAAVQCGTTPCVEGNNTVSVTVASINSNFKSITVNVTGAGNAVLTAIVGNY